MSYNYRVTTADKDVLAHHFASLGLKGSWQVRDCGLLVERFDLPGVIIVLWPEMKKLAVYGEAKGALARVAQRLANSGGPICSA